MLSSVASTDLWQVIVFAKADAVVLLYPHLDSGDLSADCQLNCALSAWL